jgi:uncharacterized protein (TIGR03792 family)
MIIEWLKFRVSPDLREEFLEIDQQIWTNKLKTRPGFLGKEVWLNPDRMDEVIMFIRWQTREEWKNIPQEELNIIEKQFAQKMQGKKYQMIESLEYQVRKFPQV